MTLATVLTTLAVSGGTVAIAVLCAFLSSLLDQGLRGGKREALLYALPRRADCGACGHASCENLAAALADGAEGATVGARTCPVGGVKTARQLAAILGVEAASSPYIRHIAHSVCPPSCPKGGRAYVYSGLPSCALQLYMPGGGAKSCKAACYGLGDCARACRFAAISTAGGVAVIDENLCTGCGLCVDKCPQRLLAVQPYNNREETPCPAARKGRA
jgi:Na+-translocating ferredoxin:NAD+ oxidoreductase RNF subunit RnfB